MEGMLQHAAERVSNSEINLQDATIEEAIRLVDSTVNLCNKAGLVLHKWVSNSREIIAAISKELRANAVQQIKPGDNLPTERVLGLLWCTESDSFCFNFEFEEHPTTRRGIMATVCSVYDPLEFLAPVMLTGKTILQNVCREGTGWDDPLPEDLKITWN
ncbi:uncharacterized protein LOC117111264 [Anneissia japonica]|uniref:uncharacterized protein LOC117111264 n=1 Tax=Anneissia japonica TaxID=1529436 RepID=UPI001425817E|nr:uncharacterized protein LOC117111264 [Anneissia japonica]